MKVRQVESVPAPLGDFPVIRARGGGHPGSGVNNEFKDLWIPAFAGMTVFFRLRLSLFMKGGSKKYQKEELPWLRF